jgi:hypothetical protein
MLPVLAPEVLQFTGIVAVLGLEKFSKIEYTVLICSFTNLSGKGSARQAGEQFPLCFETTCRR